MAANKRCGRKAALRRCGNRGVALRLEPLEPRTLLNGTSFTVPLDKDLDQFGDQIPTVQSYGGTSRATFSIFDTGASVVTFSPEDQANFSFLGNPIPIKVQGGAVALGIGGMIVGDVSQPGAILADGMHAMELSFDHDGFPIFDMSLATSIETPGIQTFVGTEVGSPGLVTITGTPVLHPSTSHPDGLAALVDMQGYALDFSGLIDGLVLTMPDIHFVSPGTAPTVFPGTTEPIYVSMGFLGFDNYDSPGDMISESPSPVQEHVQLINANTGKTLQDKHLLFDTGAQLSVISTEVATSLGLDLSQPDLPAIAVEGVGGSVSIPGFMLSELNMPTSDGGTLRLTNVPVYVLDVGDGLDGILGMNLLNTAASFVYDPYNPSGARVGFTFYTDPDRGAGQIDPGLLGMIEALGGSFAGAMTGQRLPNFELDHPDVISVLPGATKLADADVGAGRFSLAVTYDTAMNTAIAPTIAFTPDVSGALSFAGGNWSGNTYTATYDVADNGVAAAGVGILVTGAQDTHGNAQSDYSIANSFGLDMQNPTVLSVTPSQLVVAGKDAGPGKFAVSVEFSETMNTAVAPALTFTPNVGSALSFAGGSWNGNVYTATYDVAGAAASFLGVGIGVTGAQDAAGNAQASFSGSKNFDIDTAPPTSAVAALPAQEHSTSFVLSWSGTDGGGSDIAFYDIYVSDNGGPFKPLLTHTTNLSASFTGAQDGHTYGFYSVATDKAGNAQATPSAATASTQVSYVVSRVAALPNYERTKSFNLNWSGSTAAAGGRIASYTVYVSDNGGPFKPLLTKAKKTSTRFNGQDGHTYGFYSVATDTAGHVQQMPSAAQAATLVDASRPTSKIAALPANENATSFVVSWAGSDGKSGSGIAGYSVYVSDNGGRFKPLLTNTTALSTTFTGQNGHRYGFYSLATDKAGNVQTKPSKAQASTKIVVSAVSVRGGTSMRAEALPRVSFDLAHADLTLQSAIAAALSQPSTLEGGSATNFARRRTSYHPNDEALMQILAEQDTGPLLAQT